MVLNGITEVDLNLFYRDNLIPILSTTKQVELWKGRGEGRACGIHIDTGMNRLGLDIGEFEGICESAEKSSRLKPILVMSHLAVAQDPHSPENLNQLSKFRGVVSRARKCWPELVFSLANSSGIFLGPDWHFDMLRPATSLIGASKGSAPLSSVTVS